MGDLVLNAGPGASDFFFFSGLGSSTFGDEEVGDGVVDEPIIPQSFLDRLINTLLMLSLSNLIYLISSGSR